MTNKLKPIFAKNAFIILMKHPEMRSVEAKKPNKLLVSNATINPSPSSVNAIHVSIGTPVLHDQIS